MVIKTSCLHILTGLIEELVYIENYISITYSMTKLQAISDNQPTTDIWMK